MKLPEFQSGLLPPGIYELTWQELVDAFGFSEKRTWLLEGLRSTSIALAAAGCERVYVDGSFVTDKLQPGDFDLCWEMDHVDIAALDPILLELRAPRAAQHVKYRGDILPNVIEGDSGVPFVDYFQIDKESGITKGIVAIDPRGVK